MSSLKFKVKEDTVRITLDVTLATRDAIKAAAKANRTAQGQIVDQMSEPFLAAYFTK